MRKNFALIGVAGYIAPRHLKAIQDNGGVLLAALDKFDSVGVLDSYFPNTDFFVEFERFDRHIEKRKREENVQLDYVSICTPNYLHDAHIRMALRSGADAICEKPLVLNPWNLDALQAMEVATGQQGVYNSAIAFASEHSCVERKNCPRAQRKNLRCGFDVPYFQRELVFCILERRRVKIWWNRL